MQNRIAIVLVEPENPDNIGSSARAMKNMGLMDLRLVKPPKAWKEKAKKLAVAAFDTLENAKVFQSLPEAVEDACLVIGTTRRKGSHRGMFLEFNEALRKIKKMAETKQTAVVFGKESKGLSNQHLVMCDSLMTIPTDDVYPSINLAQAVMLVGFSLMLEKNREEDTSSLSLVPKKETEIALERLHKALHTLGYKTAVSGRILATFRALLKRSGLKESEAQMLKGLSRRILERKKYEVFARE